MKTEIYVRHRDACSKKGDRQSFDGCPVYARYRVRDLLTGEVLENFHGSLKGITNETAAIEYVENRFLLLRNGLLKPAKKGKTVSEAADEFIEDKRRELGTIPYGKVSTRMLARFRRLGQEVPTEREHDQIKKVKLLLGRFTEFCDEKNIGSIVNVEYAHLTEFLEDVRYGRTVSIVKDGEIVDRVTMPPVDATKKYNQSIIKGWFLWMRLHKIIENNPAELLRPLRKPVRLQSDSPEATETPWTPDMIAKVVTVIPKIHERPQRLLGYFKLLVYTAARITDVAAMEVGRLDDDGIEYWNHKTCSWAYAALPPSLVHHLRNGFNHRSQNHFFWTGFGTPKSTSNYYSGKLLEAYRAAGIPEKYQGGPRSHEFRDTTGTMLMEKDGGKLEDAQLALNHALRSTTELHYIQKTKLRYAQVNQKKREMWEKEGMWE